MNFKECAVVSAEQILNSYGVDLKVGLHDQQVKKQQEVYGFNEINAHEVRWYHILFRQFTSPFVLLLMVSALIALFLGEHLDSLMMIAIVFINTLVGFYQEYSAHRIVRFLKTLIQPYARVVRAGEVVLIAQRELVPGDIVVLNPGDNIPADVRFVQTHNVMVDESLLTGESTAVIKNAEAMGQVPLEPFEAVNTGFFGTTIMTGSARAVVIATGSATALGDIVHLTEQGEHVGVFQKDIARFSVFIMKIIVVTIALVFAVNLVLKRGSIAPVDLLLFSLALALGITPEALPVVTMFALARGARRLARNKVVVKRLSAIDDLGSIQVLCTDKTGTLTENILTVVDSYPKDSRVALVYAAIASTSWDAKKNEYAAGWDAAFWKALTEQEKDVVKSYALEHEVPFDAGKRFFNVVTVQKNDAYEVVIRGVYEEVIARCTTAANSERDAWVTQQGLEGRRVIALAYKTVSSSELATEDNFEFIGLVCAEDPIKNTAADSIKKARKLGVAIKVLSGDAPEVAGAIGKKVHLITQSDEVITGAAYEALSDADKKEAVERCTIFARVSPQQKYDIIKMLQQTYEVGYLGDGFNDTPALKIANVGIVVQGAVDSAREAADIILLQKSLRVIVDGIHEGRVVFNNIVKYIRLDLSSNFGNFYSIAVLSLFLDFLPMLPLQILLVNLISDVPLLMMATDTVDEQDIQKPISFDVKEIIKRSTVLGLVSSLFDWLFFGWLHCLAAPALRTGWFMYSILTETVLIFSLRTKRFFANAVRASWQLLAAAVFAVTAALSIPYTAFGQELFNFVAPQAHELAILVIFTAAYFVVTETVKLMYARYNHG